MTPESLTKLFLTTKSQLCFGGARYLRLQVYSIFHSEITVEVQSRQMTCMMDVLTKGKHRLQGFKGGVQRKDKCVSEVSLKKK